MSHYDMRTQSALDRWLADLPADVHDAVRDTLQDAAGSTRAWWAAVGSGTPEPPSGEPDDEMFLLQPGGGLVAAVGAEDAEHPAASGTGHVLHLQRRLTDVVDRRVASALASSLKQAGRWADVQRLTDASDPECNHDWLWQGSPEIGPVYTATEYVTAVRLLLGEAPRGDNVETRGVDIVGSMGEILLA